MKINALDFAPLLDVPCSGLIRVTPQNHHDVGRPIIDGTANSFAQPSITSDVNNKRLLARKIREYVSSIVASFLAISDHPQVPSMEFTK